MKKQHILQSLMAAIIALSFTACQEDELVPANSYIAEGIPVVTQIPISIPKMEVMQTRALSDEQERTMTDLYVIIFDKDRNREASYYFKPNADNAWELAETNGGGAATIAHTHNTTDEGKTEGTLTLAMTSGQKFIYGFANVDNNALGQSYKANLDAVNKQQDLKDIYVSFFGNNVSTLAADDNAGLPQTANIPMSGAFDDNNADTAEGSCVINPDGTVKTKGTIKLRRLFAKITFTVKKGDAVEKFILDKWQAVHLPQSSPLMESEGETPTTFTYKNSLEDTPNASLSNVKNGSYGFDFYMLENKKNFIGAVPERFTYAKRETPGTEEQEFAYVTNNATYIRLKGTLEMTKAGGTVTNLQDGTEISEAVKRYADVEYIIHLGGQEPNTESEPDVDNFDVLRNTSYTYEVTINGVDDIVVKVNQKSDDRPGENGRVIDITGNGAKYELDCHNHVFDITLKNIEEKPFLFRLMSPDGTVIDNIALQDGKWVANNATDANELYKSGYGKNASLLTWIQFRASETWQGAPQLAYYDPTATWKNGSMPVKPIATSTDADADYNDGVAGANTNIYVNNRRNGNERGITPLMNLYELAEYVDRMEPGKEQHFTVFVKEYYYETNPATKNPTDTDLATDWGKNNWNEFVNKENRSVVLDLYTINYDKSSYSQGDIYITQQSIQTFYSGTNIVALGVEHQNETGRPIYKNQTDNLINANNWFHKDIDGKTRAGYMTALNQVSNNAYLTPDNGYFNQYMALLKYGIGQKNWADYLCLQDPIGQYPDNENYKERHDANEKNLNGELINPVINTVRRIENNYNYEAIVDCLTRNRDEDGDGVLDPEEMKWYLPAVNQLNEIYLGATALKTPLFNPLTDKYWGQTHYHYLSSDLRTFWGEEGNSTGGADQGERWRNSRIRCVRNLGAAYPKKNTPASAYYFNDDEETNTKPELYKYDGTTRVFTFPNLDASNFRFIPVTGGELQALDATKYSGLHTNFNEQLKINLLYSGGFQVAENFITGNDLKKQVVKTYADGNPVVDDNGNIQYEYVNYGVGGNGEIPGYMQNWTPCSEYSEAPNGSDKGTWRLPNQKELSMMVEEKLFIEVKEDGTKEYHGNVPSCTAWSEPTNHNRTFMIHDGGTTEDGFYMFLNNVNDPQNIGSVRCVRDYLYK